MTIRLATIPHPALDNTLRTVRRPPGLLVSFFYLKDFLRNRGDFNYRDWAMDSGAFSAHNSGKEIDFAEYMETCHHLLTNDPKLVEVFSLDVIGDHKASRKNTEKMWKEGIPAIPTFHWGEPWQALLDMAKHYPKISLGGVVGKGAKVKMEWVGQCFARTWPKKIHGLGMSGEKMLMSFPFDSVDASNWEMAPTAYGHWQTMGKMSVRGSQQQLQGEVAYFLDLEDRARVKWKKEMALLDSVGGPDLRLACRSTTRTPEALSRK